MNCEFCQSPAHIWFQCPKKPDGWRPARLANKSSEQLDKSRNSGGGHHALPVVGRSVDSRPRKKALAGDMPSVNERPEREGKLVQVQQPRSAPKFDRQAWMREYMRTYMRDRRAKLKAQKAP